jgi:hypothetical protein
MKGSLVQMIEPPGRMPSSSGQVHLRTEHICCQMATRLELKEEALLVLYAAREGLLLIELHKLRGQHDVLDGIWDGP